MTSSVLFAGGRVFTGRRYVEALLVEDGRVLAAGEERRLRSDAPTGTETVRLDGSLVVPGLADAHLHVGELARLRDSPDLRGATSAVSLTDRIAEWAGDHPNGPVVGRGFDVAGLAPATWPTAADLDRAVGNRPVVIYDRSGHVAFLNSVALERLELDRAGREALPEGIQRARDGNPTGVLVEEAMRRLAGRVVEREPPSRGALRATLEELVALGLTGVGAMSVGTEELEALREVADRFPGVPSIRAYARLASVRTLRSDPETPARRCALVGVKVFLDGAFGPRTASLSEPYADDPAATGIAVGDDDALRDELADAATRGLAPAVHAIGDRAVERAVRLLAGVPLGERAVARIEHASLVPPALLGPLARSRAALVVQPGFVVTDWWLSARLGKYRARWAYPFRTLGGLGLVMAGSSDAPFCPPDPWWGMRAAVARRDPDGRSASSEPSERLSPEEALGLYTTGARRAMGETDAHGLEPGSRADLLVLAVPRLSTALEAAGPVAQVWLGGVLARPRPEVEVPRS